MSDINLNLKKLENFLNQIMGEFPIKLNDEITLYFRPLSIQEEQEAHIAASQKRKEVEDELAYFYQLKIEILSRALSKIADFSISELGDSALSHSRDFFSKLPTEVVNYLFNTWSKNTNDRLNNFKISEEQTDLNEVNTLRVPEDTKAETQEDIKGEELQEKQARIKQGMKELKQKYENKEVKPVNPAIYKLGQHGDGILENEESKMD